MPEQTKDRTLVVPSGRQESTQGFMNEIKEELAAVDKFEAALGRSTSHTRFHRKRLEKKLAELGLLVN